MRRGKEIAVKKPTLSRHLPVDRKLQVDRETLRQLDAGALREGQTRAEDPCPTGSDTE